MANTERVGFLRMNLMAKLMVFFLVVALVPTGIVVWLSFRSQKSALEQAEYKGLNEARRLRKTEISNYLDQTLTNLKFLATSASVSEAFRKMTGSGDSMEWVVMPAELRAKVVGDLEQLMARWIQAFGKRNDYEDVLLINTDSDIVYAHKGGSELDANLMKDKQFEGSALRKLWSRIMKTQKAGMSDFSYYKPADSTSAFLGVPVVGQQGTQSGVLFLRLGPQKIDEVFRAVADSSKGIKAYLVGSDYLLRPGGASGGKGAPQTGAKVETEAVKRALDGQSGTMIISSEDGRQTLYSYSPVDLKENKSLGADFDWAIISQVDGQEAFRPVTELLNRAVLIMLLSCLGVGLMAFILAGSIARPVRSMAEHAAKVSAGDLTSELPALRRSDEIGALAESFRLMVVNLREQAKQVREGVGVLSSSVMEISGTVSQLAAGTSKTASAVTETTSTVSEVREAANASNSMAQSVSVASRQAVQVSESGAKATEETIERMNLIKEQMKSVGDTVIMLNEQGAAVEQIIEAVQDLADQSNLLAVNASIEAARAGEQGRGFAVVAHEIKSLADQSKQATDQVRNILRDTREWISAVVLATEKGMQAVDAGVQQSALAGESIAALNNSVLQSSDAAGIIETTSNQQAVAVEQVSEAMKRIEQAMTENMQSTNQLESAAERLRRLGEHLEESVGRYKV